MNKKFKKILKPVLLPLYRLIKKRLQKDRIWLRVLLSMVSPVYASKYLYKKTFNKKLDLNNPQTLNEKCMWLKLNTYYNNPLITECCDKYLVHNYVKRMGCGKILNDLIGVWDKADDIDFSSLPDSFVLKCNHGCGYNIFCSDKKNTDFVPIKKQLNAWLNEDYWKFFAETQYKFIKKKIICEKFLDMGINMLPVDYKFFCVNGVVDFFLVCIGREIAEGKEEGEPDFYFFDKNFNYLPQYFSTEITMPHPDSKYIPSSIIKKMFDYAEKLAKPFPFVRVDFYFVQGKIIFGELTFVPSGGLNCKNYASQKFSINLKQVVKM